MPLTPEDVSNKRFTPVRLREGYDMGEVDAFLDEVEAELSRLHKENDDLRAKLEAATNGTVPAAAPAPEAEKPAPEPVEEPEKPAEKPAEPAAAEAPAPATADLRAPSEQIRVTTAAEASSAATRLLELATRNADELVTDARQEAEQILQVARTDAERLQSETQAEAERLQAESKAEAERLDAEARSRAQQLDAETEARRREALGDIEREKTRLDSEVTNLRTFEREYRDRLKSYFTEQLSALDGSLEPEQATGQAS